MTRLQRNLLGIVSLAAAGFISGIVSPVFPPGMSWQVAVFPAIMAAALWLACGMRSIPRAILFFFAGLGSYYLALRVSWAALYFSPFRFFDYFDPESPGFISDKVAFGGIAGSAVVIAAFYASFLPHLDWRRWLWKSLLWSGMGGLLAFAGWLLENKLYLPEFGFIVVTWQTGMGALLGTLLWLEKRSATTASQENSAPISRLGRRLDWGLSAFWLFCQCMAFRSAGNTISLPWPSGQPPRKKGKRTWKELTPGRASRPISVRN